MAGSEVALKAPEVPALAPTPATTITAEDIAIPRLYVGNFMSEAVKRSRVKFGDVYLAQNADDNDPQVLWSLDSKDPGVLAHVLHLKKGKSWSPGQGEPLVMWDFDDPTAHPDAWTTYTYTLFLPEVDPDMPARVLITKSGRGTAQRINTVLARNASAGPAWMNAFRITSAHRQKDKNEWAIFEARLDTATQEHVNQATEMFELIAPSLVQPSRNHVTPGSEEPGI